MQENNHKKYYRYAVLLAWATIVYNIVEAFFALSFGLSNETLTLFGFGLDSLVEVISATGVLQMVHRIGRNPNSPPSDFERRALKITGWCFYILALILLSSSAISLYQGHSPVSTLPGVIIALISILTMWALIWAKTRVGKKLQSRAIVADARCNLVCLYMSLVLLLSSGLHYAFSLPYVDALGALVLTWFSFNEGREAFEKAGKRGEAV